MTVDSEHNKQIRTTPRRQPLIEIPDSDHKLSITSDLISKPLMTGKRIAILVYGAPGSGRNALTEEKYKDLTTALISSGYAVESVLYHDIIADQLRTDLTQYAAILVWVNPIEHSGNRTILDSLLREIASQGCIVSTHPDTILKIGTKGVLYDTREMGWGGDIRIYRNYDEFKHVFLLNLEETPDRVLKQYRGNGGNGVFRVEFRPGGDHFARVTHAVGNEAHYVTGDELLSWFHPFFSDGGILLDQPWNANLANGMVRCYLVGSRVAGFGYQEINALYRDGEGCYIPPSKRYYFTEHCGLFQDLRNMMEETWVPQLRQMFAITESEMPVIWDADFFITNEDSPQLGKYSLCEINVSCVSPFPPSAIPYIVEETTRRLNG